MSNVRKTWKTLSAVPDPFEPGVVYVTQELTGYETSTDGQATWKPVSGPTVEKNWPGGFGYTVTEPVAPETRVQRCRLHPSGRLENTDVAPKDINSQHKVQIHLPPDSSLEELAKALRRKTALREENPKTKHPRDMSPEELKAAGGFTLRGPDGRVTDIFMPEDYVWPEEDTRPWLSGDIPVPPAQALGFLHQWIKTPGARVAMLGYGKSTTLRGNFLRVLLKNSVLKPVNYTITGSGPIEIQGLDETAKPLRLEFYGTDRPEELRGPQAHYFMVEDRVVNDTGLPNDASGLNSLENLELMTRLTNPPNGIVLESF